MLGIAVQLAYLLAAVCFVLGLKGMSRPKTAVAANALGAVGMLLAVVATLIATWRGGGRFEFVALGLAAGTVAGLVLALRIPMTAMPQMVALLNGFGGGASVLVAGAELLVAGPHGSLGLDVLIAMACSNIIGAVTFTGSLVAYAKLDEWQAFARPWVFVLQKPANLLLAVASLALAAAFVALAGGPQSGMALAAFWGLAVMAGVLGVLVTVPIGGADMPVVVALLNSYSGLAASATGFVIDNNVLIITGSLVGASGIILSQIMCRAMNRSLLGVLFGTAAGANGRADDSVYATVRRTTAADVALLLESASRVVFVPGYGMAVAQAQHAVRDLTQILTKSGIAVEFAIHPVAGRMPGHMNVLLAEADISYEMMKEMDEINSTMNSVDVAIVVGANDVVNPLARLDASSPIAGMPIINVDQARNVVIIKRSLSPGFAGIANPLFGAANAVMLFEDARRGVLEIVKEMKET